MTAQEALARPHLAKLKIEDFLTLERAGTFEGYARAELIEGEIWVVNATYTRHAAIHMALSGLIWNRLREVGSDLVALTTPALPFSDDSLPEPDIVVGAPHDEAGFYPLGKVRLLIEVADTSIELDLGRKLVLYARHGVPEYWVADVNARVIHQMWAPEGEAYAERREVAFEERIAAATIAELAVETVGLGSKSIATHPKL